MRGSGVEIPFRLVAVAPVGTAVPDAPPRSAYIVAPGTSVAVVARELASDTSDTVMRCGFGRLVPAGESASEGAVNELQVRVALVGGRQTISSEFRRYPALLLQPAEIPGTGTAPKRRCGARPVEPAAPAVRRDGARDRPDEPPS
jgi:hypothetical protein